MKFKITNKKITIFLITISIISCLCLFFTNYFKNSHDIVFHLARIDALTNELKLGRFLPAIYTDYLNGYGYANGLFYPDIFLYIPSFLHYIGINLTNSYKIFIVIISILSTFSMYYTVNKISKNKTSAIISSIIYCSSSYRLVDALERAALGETIGFIFIPLVILGIYYIVYDDYKKWFILTIGMSGLLLSHLLSAYMIAFLLVVITLINIKKLFKEQKRIIAIFKAAIITILLCAFFVFPMLEQMLEGNFRFHHMDDFNSMEKRAVPFIYIFLGIPNTLKPWNPSGIGLIFFIIIIYTLIKKPKLSNFHKFSLYSSLVMIILSSNLFPWKYFEFLNMIQFPWRLYALITLLLSILGGEISKNILNKKILYITLFLLSFTSIIINSINYLVLKDSEPFFYHVSNGEYLPYEVNVEEIKQKGNVVVSNNPLSITLLKEKIYSLNIQNNNYNDSYIELPLLYYKGYIGVYDDKEIIPKKSNNGLVLFEINDLNNIDLDIYYKGTTIRNISRYISLITIIIIISYFIIKRIKTLKS